MITQGNRIFRKIGDSVKNKTIRCMEKFRKEKKESIEGKNLCLINYKNKQNRISRIEYRNTKIRHLMRQLRIITYIITGTYIYIYQVIYTRKRTRLENTLQSLNFTSAKRKEEGFRK